MTTVASLLTANAEDSSGLSSPDETLSQVRDEAHVETNQADPSSKRPEGQIRAP